MQPITVWLRFNVKTQRWDHNHIEDGHVSIDANKPIGKLPEQTKTWNKSTWIFNHKYLNDKQQVI